LEVIGELVRSGLRKAKKAGGGAHGYFDSGSHISKTPDPDTPFLRAVDVVDRRDGHAVMLAKTWRAGAVAAAVLAVAMAGGWAWERHRSTVEWLVVPVDRFGEPGEISTPAVFEPSTAQLAERAQEVVKSAFSLSTDPRVNEANYEFLRNTLSGTAIKSWAAWWDEAKDDQPSERTVRIITVKPSASPRTLNIVWQEADYRDGKPVFPTRRINGDLTLEYRHPKNRADAQRNKLGIWVTAMRFAPEVGR
jgi:type IV secretion system protein TrbF